MKKCPECLIDKPVDEFYRIKTKTGGKKCSSYCKECTRRISLARYHGPNHEKIKAAQEIAAEKFRSSPKYAASKKDVAAGRYGMTREEYEAFVARPCDICGAEDRKRGVDHDHDTNKNRGALCHQCNVGIGMFKDDPDRLREAAAYLEGY